MIWFSHCPHSHFAEGIEALRGKAILQRDQLHVLRLHCAAEETGVFSSLAIDRAVEVF